MYIFKFMEFRLRPLGFMEFFAKQQSSGSYFHFLNCLMIVVLQKNSMKPRGRSLNSMN